MLPHFGSVSAFEVLSAMLTEDGPKLAHGVFRKDCQTMMPAGDNVGPDTVNLFIQTYTNIYLLYLTF